MDSFRTRFLALCDRILEGVAEKGPIEELLRLQWQLMDLCYATQFEEAVSFHLLPCPSELLPDYELIQTDVEVCKSLVESPRQATGVDLMRAILRYDVIDLGSCAITRDAKCSTVRSRKTTRWKVASRHIRTVQFVAAYRAAVTELYLHGIWPLSANYMRRIRSRFRELANLLKPEINDLKSNANGGFSLPAVLTALNSLDVAFRDFEDHVTPILNAAREIARATSSASMDSRSGPDSKLTLSLPGEDPFSYSELALILLRRNPERSMSSIAEAVGCAASTLSRDPDFQAAKLAVRPNPRARRDFIDPDDEESQ